MRLLNLFLAILTTVNAGDLKTINQIHLHVIQNLFYHQLMAVEEISDHKDKEYLLNCHLYRYLLFLFDLKDIKDHLEFQQLLHPEILNN